MSNYSEPQFVNYKLSEGYIWVLWVFECWNYKSGRNQTQVIICPQLIDLLKLKKLEPRWHNNTAAVSFRLSVHHRVFSERNAGRCQVTTTWQIWRENQEKTNSSMSGLGWYGRREMLLTGTRHDGGGDAQDMQSLWGPPVETVLPDWCLCLTALTERITREKLHLSLPLLFPLPPPPPLPSISVVLFHVYLFLLESQLWFLSRFDFPWHIW